MNNPKVSIVIPVYNGSNFLREAIDSAMGQTYKNVEIIVVNDGSNDEGKTEAICLSYGDKIRYFKKENGGVASALNLGIKNMTGDYFAWLSHDDLFAENRVESDIEFFSANFDIKVCYCSPLMIDENGNELMSINYPKEIIYNPFEALSVGALDMCGITLARECFLNAGMLNETNVTMQDVEFVLSLSKHYVMKHNNKTSFSKRIHGEMGTKVLKQQHAIDQRRLFDRLGENFQLLDFFPEVDLTEKLIVSAKYDLLGDLFSGYGSFHHADRFYKLSHNYIGGFFVYSFLLKTIGSETFHYTMSKNIATRFFRRIFRKIFPR